MNDDEDDETLNDCDFDADRYARKPPFIWFGGKSVAAPAVWNLLGDVEHYVEPFAGGLGVLLNRPHPCNRTYHSETVNDLDGFIVNAWRAIAAEPDAVAEAASWPVTECDKTARQIALLRWREDGAAEKLAGSADWFDARMAGWWLWAVGTEIGAFDGKGAWTADRSTGRIVKMSSDRASRAPGVLRSKPRMTCGNGVNAQTLREPGLGDFHAMTMPRLRIWMRLLAARLRHVRVLNGDWTRACTGGVMRTLTVARGGTCGLFLDPPYTSAVRTMGLYASESGDVAHAVRDWCAENDDKPWLRIVLAGLDGEHDALIERGWKRHEWFKRTNYLSGGRSQRGHEERLWSSPSCLNPSESESQLNLFHAEEAPA